MNAEFQVTILSQLMMRESKEYQSLQVTVFHLFLSRGKHC